MIDWMICPVCGQPFDSVLGQPFAAGALPLCPLCFEKQKNRDKRKE